MRTIDLRSDTVTLPTPEMRHAMARAEVGDDVFREDPTVRRLEEMAAERMGKEAGLFVPSGTMGNLIAVLAHCGRGDEVILGDRCHTFLSEAGGVAAVGGVHPHPVATAQDGTLPLEEIEAALRPDDPHYPASRLICLENTHNRCGGVPIAAGYTASVGEWAHRRGLRLHIDGARIFNAAVALGNRPEDLAAGADSVTFCLSKALCAPVGSVLCGASDFVARARRTRKQLGGGMRQAGVLAAAGIVALETMVDRLAEDHRRARDLAGRLAGLHGLALEWNPPPTNMVYLNLEPQLKLDGEAMVDRLKRGGVLALAEGPRTVRLVTHYWIGDEDIVQASQVIARCMEEAV
ncbi:MAG TPA: low-specificity L-threonine aldolase [Anaerolineales bacterium]